MITRYSTLTLLVLTVLWNLLPAPAQAASPLLSATLYPAGAHITYRPVLTNEQLDCLCGFFCEGNLPLYHFTTQDALHRTGGWGQFAGITRHGRVTMAFELFSSSGRDPTQRRLQMTVRVALAFVAEGALFGASSASLALPPGSVHLRSRSFRDSPDSFALNSP